MRQDIYASLRDRIIHLAFKPGDPLSENKLAEEFQVSRTPIREALHRLSSEGLVNIIPNLGARVSEINLRDLRELIEYRIILERGCARLVARNAIDNDIQALQRLNEKVQSEKTEDLDRLTDLDYEFHLLTRKASHNKLLIRQMEVVQIKFTWVMRSINYKPDLFMVRIPDVIEAMKRKDADRMEHILIEHVDYFVDKMRRETMENI